MTGNEDDRQDHNSSSICPICLEELIVCSSLNLDPAFFHSGIGNAGGIGTGTRRTGNREGRDGQQQALGTAECGHVFHCECFASWRASQVAARNDILQSSSSSTRRLVRTRVKCPTCNKRTKSFVKLYLSPPHHGTTAAASVATNNQLEDLERKLRRFEEKCMRYRRKSRDLQLRLEELQAEKETLQLKYQQTTIELARQTTIHEDLERWKVQKLKELEDEIRGELLVQQDQFSSSLRYLTSKLSLADQEANNEALQQLHDQILVVAEADHVLLQARCLELERLVEETRNSHGLAVMQLSMELDAVCTQNRALCAGEDMQQQPSSDKELAVGIASRNEILDLCRRVQVLESQCEEFAVQQREQGMGRKHLDHSSHPEVVTVPSSQSQQQQQRSSAPTLLLFSQSQQPQERQQQRQSVAASTSGKAVNTLVATGFLCRHGTNPIFFR
jgi:hypothetical protein